MEVDMRARGLSYGCLSASASQNSNNLFADGEHQKPTIDLKIDPIGEPILLQSFVPSFADLVILWYVVNVWHKTYKTINCSNKQSMYSWHTIADYGLPYQCHTISNLITFQFICSWDLRLSDSNFESLMLMSRLFCKGRQPSSIKGWLKTKEWRVLILAWKGVVFHKPTVLPRKERHAGIEWGWPCEGISRGIPACRYKWGNWIILVQINI